MFHPKLFLLSFINVGLLTSNYVTGWILSPSNRNSIIKHRTIPASNNPTNWIQQRSVLQQSSSSSSSSSSSEESNRNVLGTTDLRDKTIYQRVLYSLSKQSDVERTDSIVIEERVRFEADPNRGDGYIQPVGPRTLILRDGNVEDGEIGDAIYTIQVPGGTHNGAGTNDYTIESTIVTALYLASNPSIVSGQLLQIDIGESGGLGTILGCIGAAYVLGDYNPKKEKTSADSIDPILDDILTIGGSNKNPFFPKTLERITITDEDESNLERALTYCQKSGMTGGIIVEPLLWRTRRMNPSSQSSPPIRGIRYKEYTTIISAGLDFTYPEAKELARTVANRVESSGRRSNPTGPIPRYVNLVSEHRRIDDVPYLRQFLQKGYKMDTSTNYITLEKLKFVYQILTSDDAMYNEDTTLDDMELELQSVVERDYQCTIATHHPDYAGGGSGELFFPIETGLYDTSSGSTYLEPEPGAQ